MAVTWPGMQKQTWFGRLRWLTKRSAPHGLGVLAATCLALAQFHGFAAVRDVADFGAKPDDDADDATAIQKAIEAASPGDTVSLPAGTFLINRALRPKSGVKIQGAARDRTILKFNAGAVQVLRGIHVLL